MVKLLPGIGGNVEKIVMGSTVIKLPSGTNSAMVFSEAQIEEMAGDFEPSETVFVATNGDLNANGYALSGAMNGGAYVVCSEDFSGQSARVNYAFLFMA